MLEDTENWLYEDGEDQPKQVYEEKLGALKVHLRSFIYSKHKEIYIFKEGLLTSDKCCDFPEVRSAHSGPAQREWRQAKSFWRAGKETAALHEVYRFLQTEGTFSNYLY